MKSMTLQKASKEGIKALGPVVERLAEAEGLIAHKQAVTVRLDALNRGEDSYE
jgi:histidinol dehydrogenase